MICAHCGVRNPAGSEHCFNCGRDLSKFIAEPTAAASGRKSNSRNIDQSSIQIADHFPRKGEPIANPELWMVPIPILGVKINDLSSCIARELASRFSWTGFHSIIERESLDKYYTADWGFNDLSSRWYALGFICLLQCVMSKTWKEMLPAPFDSEVYRATIRAMRSLWEMGDAIEQKVDSFMIDNLQCITQSLNNIKNEQSSELWCTRYTRRLVGIGANSAWIIADDEKWRRSHLSEEEIYGDVIPKKRLSSLRDISELAYDCAFSAVMEVISQSDITNHEYDTDSIESINRIATAIAGKVAGCFDVQGFMDSDSLDNYFAAGWSIDDSLIRWYSLARICLIHCSTSRRWAEILQGPFGKEVQKATVDMMSEIWGIPEAVKSQVDLFVTQNICGIIESLGAMEIPKYRKEWFERYKARLFGRNPLWVIPEDGRSKLEDTLAEEIRIGDDLWGLFQSIKYFLKPEITLEPVLRLLDAKASR